MYNNNFKLERATYMNSMGDLKYFFQSQMKIYDQKTTNWADKHQQSNRKDIMNETKSVTDWLMEDIYHIRNGTINSFSLDLSGEVNMAIQNSMYHKFEEKLLLLLQMILYRNHIPNWRPPKREIGKPYPTEKELREKRLQVEMQKQDDESYFSKLRFTEKQLLNDMKKLLVDMSPIQDIPIDGRQKTELFRLFLIDYRDIAKFKNKQLQRIQQIEQELVDIEECIQNYTTENKSINRQYSVGSQMPSIASMQNRIIALKEEKLEILKNSAQILKVHPYKKKNDHQRNKETNNDQIDDFQDDGDVSDDDDVDDDEEEEDDDDDNDNDDVNVNDGDKEKDQGDDENSSKQQSSNFQKSSREKNLFPLPPGSSEIHSKDSNQDPFKKDEKVKELNLLEQQKNLKSGKRITSKSPLPVVLKQSQPKSRDINNQSTAFDASDEKKTPKSSKYSVVSSSNSSTHKTAASSSKKYIYSTPQKNQVQSSFTKDKEQVKPESSLQTLHNINWKEVLKIKK